jgi:hypothetical protein
MLVLELFQQLQRCHHLWVFHGFLFRNAHVVMFTMVSPVTFTLLSPVMNTLVLPNTFIHKRRAYNDLAIC